ncbi:hypothetical protein [Xanthomonas vesicatoria]|uniref:hypothetical protein n=1 Tax=Xanthomonas vesicatoria TaxID=56460 RepID=UPI001E412A9F|nr:hypothetical protein [Xanthomonas vesicatoria]MCC8627125.1 hypothetical protein [Xanthomonas vesicatoria]MDG4482702.1 hypothetical protein [Xanthomonas vesicatoria]
MIANISRLLIVSFLGLSACATPGQGIKAQKAKKIGDDLVRSLEVYRNEKKAYPRSIDEFDDYAGIAAAAHSVYVKVFFFSDGHEYYELMIKCFGPGSNLCVHRSTDEAGIWDCTGAY